MLDDEWSDLESTASTIQPRRGRVSRAAYGSPMSRLMLPRTSLPAPMPLRDNFDELAISPVQSMSMLTCNKFFKERFPIIYQGLCKGLIDVRMLMAYDIVVPVRESVQLKRRVVRSSRHVIAAVALHLRKALSGKFPNPRAANKITQRVAHHIWNQLVSCVRDAEDERTFLQWLFRLEVVTDVDIRLSVDNVDDPHSSVLTQIEGAAHVVRNKGEFFSLFNPDTLIIDIECVIKALFVNAGQLAAMNKDSQFIDFVRTGDNRFAKRLMY